MRIILTFMVVLATLFMPTDIVAQQGVSSVLQIGAPDKAGTVTFNVTVFDTKHNKIGTTPVIVNIDAEDDANEKAEKIKDGVQAGLDGNAVLDNAIEVGNLANVVAITTTGNADVGSIKVDKVRDKTSQDMVVDKRKINNPPLVPGQPKASWQRADFELGVIFELEGVPVGISAKGEPSYVTLGMEGAQVTTATYPGDSHLSVLTRLRNQFVMQGYFAMVVFPSNRLIVIDAEMDGWIEHVYTAAHDAGLDVGWDIASR